MGEAKASRALQGCCWLECGPAIVAGGLRPLTGFSRGRHVTDLQLVWDWHLGGGGWGLRQTAPPQIFAELTPHPLHWQNYL